MFPQWLKEHKKEILNTFIAIRREEGDSRSDEDILRGTEVIVTTLIQSLQGEIDWTDTITAAAHQSLALGTPMAAVTTASRGIYLAVQRVLNQTSPPQIAEWLSILGDYMLQGSQVATKVLESNLEEQISQRTQDANVFKSMADNSLDAILIIDQEGRLSYANQAAHHIFGYDYAQQEMIGQPITAHWSEEDVEYLQETILPQAGQQGWIGEVHQQRQGGSPFEASLAVFSLSDEQGQSLGHGAILRDISEQKQAQKALQESEQRFRTLFDNSADPALLIENGEFIDCNQAAIEMLGMASKEELLNTQPSKISPERQSDGRLSADLESEILARAFEEGSQRFEWLHRRTNGDVFPVEVSLTLITHQGRHLIHTMWRDITEQKRAQAERDRLQQEIIEAQQQALKELSTPIIPVMDRILVMPLIGSIDTMRARDITRSLLAGIREHRAKVVILDITGVPIVDSGVADHLNKTIQAARLKGARTIVTGISDAVAETIVDLGIDWTGIETLSDLQTGLIAALNSLGVRLSK